MLGLRNYIISFLVYNETSNFLESTMVGFSERCCLDTLSEDTAL